MNNDSSAKGDLMQKKERSIKSECKISLNTIFEDDAANE